MAGQTINVSVLADTKQFSSAMKNLSGSSGVGRLGTAMKRVGAGVAIGLGTAAGAATAFSISAVKDAGNLEQSIGAIDTVFGKNASQMHKWSAQAAQDVGLTKNEFNELGTLIGSQLKNGGTAMADLAPKTNDLIKLGGDLSSMFGGDTRTAVEALSSALKGERDPIEKYGVSLNQAAIDAKAAELGFKKVGGSLSAEANQAATMALIMEQTSDAHGNFAKEANTLQGQQQRLTAEWANMKTTIGTALLPVITKAFTWINANAVPAVKNLIGAFQGGGIGDFTAKLGLDKIEPAFTRITQGFKSFVAAFRSGESSAAGGFMEKLGAGARTVGEAVTTAVTTIGPPLQQFVSTLVTKLGPILTTIVETALPVFATALRTLAPIIGEIVTSVGSLIGALAERLGPIIEWLAPFIQQAFTNILGVLGPVLQFIAALIRTVAAVIRGDWGAAWQGIKDMFSAVWQLIKNVVSNALATIKLLLSQAWPAIKAAAAAAWNGIKAAISAVWNGIKAMISNQINLIKAGLSTAWTAIKTAASAAWTWVKDKIVGLVTGLKTQALNRVDQLRAAIAQKWEQIKGTAIRAFEAIKARVVAAVESLKSGVSQRVDRVKAVFTGLPGQIKSALGNTGSMLLSAGQNIISGLVTGIKNKIGDVKSTLTGLTNDIPKWKGPAQRDKTLLGGAGQLVIQGFIDGMESQYGGVKASLAGLTDDVASTSFSAPRVRGVARRRLDVVSGQGQTTAAGVVADNIVRLHPEDRTLLARLADRPVRLNVDGRTFGATIARVYDDRLVRAVTTPRGRFRG